MGSKYPAANARGQILGLGVASGIVQTLPTSLNAMNGVLGGVAFYAVNGCFCVDLCGRILYFNVALVKMSAQKASDRPEFASADRAALRIV